MRGTDQHGIVVPYIQPAATELLNSLLTSSSIPCDVASVSRQSSNSVLWTAKGEEEYATVSLCYIDGGLDLGPLVNANAAPAKPPAKAVIGQPTTPIQHLVIIFQENVSFDHYFGTYPNALNPPPPDGGPKFYPLPGTPTVNGFSPALLNNNPNLNPANGSGATNPFRLDRTQVYTADQDHDYGPEQAAFDGGLMDLFPAQRGDRGTSAVLRPSGRSHYRAGMGYYDGNTTTALWNYAQYYS